MYNYSWMMHLSSLQPPVSTGSLATVESVSLRATCATSLTTAEMAVTKSKDVVIQITIRLLIQGCTIAHEICADARIVYFHRMYNIIIIP